MVAPADLSTKFALDVQAVNGLRVAPARQTRLDLKRLPGSSRRCSWA